MKGEGIYFAKKYKRNFHKVICTIVSGRNVNKAETVCNHPPQKLQYTLFSRNSYYIPGILRKGIVSFPQTQIF